MYNFLITRSYLLCVVYSNKTNFARSTVTVPSPYRYKYINIHFP